MSSVQRRAPLIRSPKRMLTLAFALSLTLAGTSVAQASWTAPGVTATASVTAGSLAVTQTGFDTLAVLYDSSTLSITKVVTVTNRGNIPAPYTLTLTAPATTLSTGVDLQTWPVATAAACSTTATSTEPTGQHWTSALTFAGSGAAALAVGTSAYFCVRSTITQAQRFALVGISAVPTVTLTSTIGTWSIAASAVYATQTVANTLTPGAPVASATTDHGTTLTWAKPADSAAIATYQVFRNGTLIGTTSATTTTYTDTGLNVLTKYTYTVKAFDAAGDASPVSDGTDVTTLGINPSAWYKVKIAGTETCIDGEKEQTASGTLLIFFGCKTTSFDNQAWQIAVASGTTYTVRAKYVANRYWDLSGTGNVNADIRTFDGSGSQTWSVVPITGGNGTFTIKNVQTNKCLDNVNALTPQGDIQVVAKTCVVGSATQAFTLTNVG
ncbi:RICIN domain-containing protein [Cryobacterium sp. GrIS_2_6]|uniref:RICIN domain-containing protein n=1 Tax=Cryobacterium sp. GrIS_2_6 TaxID=3162785 RepID=UPI002DFA1DA8|nr:hypothetical protein [Cryobacterium psychrotolerans]